MVQLDKAQLSMNLRRLFPQGAQVHVAELRGTGDPALLLPAEAAFLGRSVASRAQEFAAGRVCARRALAEFGIADFPIERAADRQPIWPQRMVGSITHTIGFCAAVVAACDTTMAVGLDSEVACAAPSIGAQLVTRHGRATRAGVETHLWPSICLASEIDWLGTLPEAQRVRAATLIFSAKEAFYKCQYALVHERLSFHDARVELPEWNGQRGTFTIAATRPIAFTTHAALPMTGQYSFHDEFVTTGLHVAA